MAFLGSIKKHSVAILGLFIMALVVAACALVVSDGLGYEGMYSSHMVHRDQTNALLKGNMYVSNDVSYIRADMVWHNDMVQQVWGLGVPVLKIPFYAIARIYGESAFPDLIIFLCYFILAVYSISLASYLWLRKRGVPEAGMYAALVTVIVGCFPPVLMILRSRFIVYEEVITFGYLYVVFLFALLIIQSLKRSSVGIFLGICVLAGLAGFVRPTLYAYAVPVFLVAVHAYWKHGKWKYLMYGGILCSLGMSLLLATNHIRFGEMTEFGHRINIAGDLNSVNLTRFDSEYATNTPLYQKLAETFGALFLFDRVPERNGLYAADIVHFQADEIRWRHMSFPAIHWYYLAGFVLMFLYARKDALSYIPVIGLMMLFVFYAHSIIISSRYTIDFAAALVLMFVLAMLHVCASRKSIRIIFAIFCICVVYIYGFMMDHAQVFRASGSSGVSGPVTVPPPMRTSTEYRVGSMPGLSQYNGKGWNYTNGRLYSSAIFFVHEPKFIKLTFECSNGECEHSLNSIKAHLGGNVLSRESETRDDREIVITFSVPAYLQSKANMEVLFLQFITIGTTIAVPDVMLKSVEWD